MTPRERLEHIKRTSEQAVPSLWYVSDDDFQWLLEKAGTCVAVEEICQVFNSFGEITPKPDSPFYKRAESRGV